LQSRIEDFRALEAELLCVSADSPEEGRELARRQRLSLWLLSDERLRVIDSYGVRHAGAGPGGGDIARPATFVLDREGVVVWRDFTESWRIRVSPERILRELRAIE
jgi:peroxiredoxin